MSDFFLDVSFETPISIYIVFGYVCQGKFAHFKRFTGLINLFKKPCGFRIFSLWIPIGIIGKGVITNRITTNRIAADSIILFRFARIVIAVK